MPNSTEHKATDDVGRNSNINANESEHDTSNYKEERNQSTGGIKITYSKEAEPKSQENIAEGANDKESNPDNTYTSSPPVVHFHQTVIESKTVNKDFVQDNSSRQKGMQRNECSSVEQVTQNTGEKVLSILHQ